MNTKLLALSFALFALFLTPHTRASEVDELRDALSKLATALAPKIEPIAPNLPEKNRPLVLTIDGITWKETTGAISIFAKPRTAKLEKALERNWDYVSEKDVHDVYWVGDLTKTDALVDVVKNHLQSISQLATSRGRPLVVVTHSWGSVLAYRAIDELGDENKGGATPLKINQLITLGSPLDSQKIGYKTTAQHYAEWEERGGASAILEYVDEWRNYWIEADTISGAISGIEQNILMASKQTRSSKAHRDYYGGNRDFSLIHQIGVDTITSSLSESAIAQAPSADIRTNESNGVNNRTTSSASELTRHHYGQDILGLRLGMAPDEAIKLLNTLKDTDQRAYTNNYTLGFPLAGQQYKIGKPYAHRIFVSSRSAAYQEMGFRQSIFVYFARPPDQNRVEAIVRQVEYRRPSITVAAFRQALINKYGMPDLSKGKHMLWGNKSCVEATYDWGVYFDSNVNIWNHFTVGGGDAGAPAGCGIRVHYVLEKAQDGFVKKYTVDLVDARRAAENIRSSRKLVADRREAVRQEQAKSSKTPDL